MTQSDLQILDLIAQLDALDTDIDNTIADISAQIADLKDLVSQSN